MLSFCSLNWKQERTIWICSGKKGTSQWKGLAKRNAASHTPFPKYSQTHLLSPKVLSTTKLSTLKYYQSRPKSTPKYWHNCAKYLGLRPPFGRDGHHCHVGAGRQAAKVLRQDQERGVGFPPLCAEDQVLCTQTFHGGAARRPVLQAAEGILTQKKCHTPQARPLRMLHGENRVKRKRKGPEG